MLKVSRELKYEKIDFLKSIFAILFLGEKNSCSNMLSLFAFQASFFTSLMLLHVNKWIFLKFPLNSFTIHPNLAGRQQKNKSIKYQLQQRIFICRQYYIGLQNPNEIWIIIICRRQAPNINSSDTQRQQKIHCILSYENHVLWK